MSLYIDKLVILCYNYNRPEVETLVKLREPELPRFLPKGKPGKPSPRPTGPQPVPA
jgi:hypothetical protein